ncbi:YqaJ viral recombinase family nuclease [Methylobacterium sp. WSM2598]|uniref:YqaJ viral recombinase family nuclease n=1 Tax=Methylobacterium sp. WSM2598 TaxID=398261 RepID=UPI000370A4C7|nr:YqaJ viral recombinase family protein [Methylobacterium sp. WSM2598]
MKVERIPFTTREAWLAARRQDVTASAAAALLGCHPFTSAYALWAEKTGRISDEAADSGPLRRGRLLEPVAVQLLADERPGWCIHSNRDYFRDRIARLGATPDTIVRCPERGLGTVQIKSVERSVFAAKWRDADTREVEVPLAYAIQAITEAHLLGASWAAVAALVVSHDIELAILDVPVHPGVVARVREAVAEFWAMVESGDRPDPDWRRDAALAASLHGGDGSALDLSGDNALPALLDERTELKARIKADEARVAEIDTEIRSKVGLAALAMLPGWKISLRAVETKAYQVAARVTRPIRITRLQQKDAAA